MSSSSQSSIAVDTRELRNVLGTFVTGVTVISTVDKNNKAHGLTANSFSSVSLDPPLVLWSQSIKSPSYAVFSESDRFSVSILAENQIDISNQFARPSEDKFSGIKVELGLGGIPIISDCAATLECTKISSIPGGDHAIFLGRVDRFRRNDVRPLVFSRGQYSVALPHVEYAIPREWTPETVIEDLHAVRLASDAVYNLSKRYDTVVGVGVWGSHGPTMVRWEEGTRPVSRNLITGQVLPILKSSTGLTFAAYRSNEEIYQGLMREFSSLDLSPDIVSATLAQMSDQLAEIRENRIVRLLGTMDFFTQYGSAIDAISVPVFNREGRLLLALTAISENKGILYDRNGEFTLALENAGKNISKKLGFEEEA